MNNKEFIDEIKKSKEKGLALIRKKNADYANDDKPFKNFDATGFVCDVSSEKAILVRMVDKIVRASNLLDREAKVKDEAIEDTLLDLANYAHILIVKLKSNENNKNNF